MSRNFKQLITQSLFYRVNWWFQSHLQPQLVCADVEVHTINVKVESDFVHYNEDDGDQAGKAEDVDHYGTDDTN